MPAKPFLVPQKSFSCPISHFRDRVSDRLGLIFLEREVLGFVSLVLR
jgi:hypothetical protein